MYFTARFATNANLKHYGAVAGRVTKNDFRYVVHVGGHPILRRALIKPGCCIAAVGADSEAYERSE